MKTAISWLLTLLLGWTLTFDTTNFLCLQVSPRGTTSFNKQAKWLFTIIKSHVPLWLRVHVQAFLLFVLAPSSFIVGIIRCRNALKAAGMHAPNIHGWLNWCKVYYYFFFAGLFILDTPMTHYMFCRWICVPFLCRRRHILTGSFYRSRVMDSCDRGTPP